MTNPTTAAQRRYLMNAAIGLLVYAVVLIVAHLLFPSATGAALVLVDLSPMLPLAYVIATGFQWFAATDEFKRKIATESFAIGGLLTWFVVLGYAFLEGDVVPRPSAWWVSFFFMLTVIVTLFISKRRYR